MFMPIITYLLQANVPAQSPWWADGFAAMRGDKTAMHPLVKYLFYRIVAV